jgi:hypothetical protein
MAIQKDKNIKISTGCRKGARLSVLLFKGNRGTKNDLTRRTIRGTSLAKLALPTFEIGNVLNMYNALNRIG